MPTSLHNSSLESPRNKSRSPRTETKQAIWIYSGELRAGRPLWGGMVTNITSEDVAELRRRFAAALSDGHGPRRLSKALADVADLIARHRAGDVPRASLAKVFSEELRRVDRKPVGSDTIRGMCRHLEAPCPRQSERPTADRRHPIPAPEAALSADLDLNRRYRTTGSPTSASIAERRARLARIGDSDEHRACTCEG